MRDEKQKMQRGIDCSFSFFLKEKEKGRIGEAGRLDVQPKKARTGFL
jgi:hypothetical protein